MNLAAMIISKAISPGGFPRGIIEIGLGHLRENHGEPLEQVLYREVFAKRFLLDLQGISAGEMIRIDISSLPISPLLNNYFVVKIPKEMTFGKTIIEAYELTFGIPAGMMGMGMGGGNPITPVMWQGNINPGMDAASRLIGSVDTVPMMGTSRLKVIGENVIRIGEMIPRFDNLWLKCSVAYSKNLENLNSNAFDVLYKAFQLLIKTFIYNETAISLDAGRLQMGQDLGIIKDIIGEYKDASETYADMLKNEIRPVLIMSDPDRYREIIETAVGRN